MVLTHLSANDRHTSIIGDFAELDITVELRSTCTDYSSVKKRLVRRIF